MENNPLAKQTKTFETVVVQKIERKEDTLEQLKRIFETLDDVKINITNDDCTRITENGCSSCPLSSSEMFDGYGCIVNILRSVSRKGRNGFTKVM